VSCVSVAVLAFLPSLRQNPAMPGAGTSDSCFDVHASGCLYMLH
jgi:hypothetical protein